MKPTLLILAAGMGSRYGGIKQLDHVGPSGETIMDYSVYDAIRAGFGKVVFIIREAIEEPFTEIILKKYKGIIPCEYVFQELNKLPQGFALPEGRQKPWGTGHAVMMASELIREPFAVINADDFYGMDSFLQMGAYLQNTDAHQMHWSMIGFQLRNTLSDYGTVSRGICKVDENRFLVNVTERHKIQRVDETIVCHDDEGKVMSLDENIPVSMNFWGFTPVLFDCLQEGFTAFLNRNIDNPTAEYYIPLEVTRQIDGHKADVRVLPTSSNWFGVTYAEEKAAAVASIQQLVAAGVYPAKLF